ncbi:T9SS type A sorting domain-containing protein [candidate division KSB1 bacterium]|nr:T9SS type A sorting domain-containing protein [candidate division KSB1 bacterium]
MYLADFDYNLVGQWKKVPKSDVKAFVNNNAPLKFQLDQNYPNPFNPSTTISFTIKEAGLVELTVYDVTGRQVKKLLERDMAAGVHKVVFDARDLASGVYYYSLKHDGLTQVKQMVLVK